MIIISEMLKEINSHFTSAVGTADFVAPDFNPVLVVAAQEAIP